MDAETPDRDLVGTIEEAYVREMLELNPLWQTAEILRRRRELWSADESILPAMRQPVGRMTESPSKTA
ncbi:MAG: hypothetical protein R3C05_29510 [Pirellulaceae bacterium]